MTILAPLLLCLPAPLQDAGAVPFSELDRELALELRADEAGAPRRGAVELTTGFRGWTQVWAQGPAGLDLALLVEDAKDGEAIAEDEDAGGGTTPFCRFTVPEDRPLRLTVSAPPGDAAASATLYFAAAPESDATVAAAMGSREWRAAAKEAARSGDREGARRALEELSLELLAVEGGAQSNAVCAELWALGFEAWELHTVPAALRAWTRACAHRERTLPPDHEDLLAARTNLGVLLRASGDLAGAREQFELVLAAYERLLPEDDPDRVGAVLNLAVVAMDSGDPWTARDAFEQVAASYERTLPEGHSDLLLAWRNLAGALRKTGAPGRAREVQERLVAAAERYLPPEHPETVRARASLASSLSELGELDRAIALQRDVRAYFEARLPAGHPELLLARNNLADMLCRRGELDEARALLESVLEEGGRALDPDDDALLLARANLSEVLRDAGELVSARDLAAAVLAARERRLPADHPDVQAARNGLALCLYELGDDARARELLELVLAARERRLPADAPALSLARMNVALFRLRDGEHAAAREVLEELYARAVAERSERDAHFLDLRGNLALARWLTGDPESARALLEADVAARTGLQPPLHPRLLAARGNLALVRRACGDLAGARDAFADLVRDYALWAPEDDLGLLRARTLLGQCLAELGEDDALRAVVADLSRGLHAQCERAVVLSPAAAYELLASSDYAVDFLLAVDELPEHDLRRDLFALLERRRAVAGEGLARGSAIAGDPRALLLAAEVGARRAELTDLASGAARGGAAPGPEELLRAVEARDAAERALRGHMAERGLAPPALDQVLLAAGLPPDAAAVGFLRHRRYVEERPPGAASEGGSRAEPDGGRDGAHAVVLTAFVLRHDGSLRRVALGPIEPLEAAVVRWRAALGSPLERGVSLDSGADDERAAGEALRALLLDPVRAAAGEQIRTVFVCPDDLVHHVPLDALPLGDGRVGDALRVVVRSSFARLTAPRPQVEGPPTLLALGAPRFDAPPDPAAAPAPARSASSPIPSRFPPLLQTRFEVEAVEALFDEALRGEALVLEGEDATRAALLAAAPGRRFLHVATHGWFARAAVRPDAPARAFLAPTPFSERVARLAPATLCGLALAGANRPRDAAGRAPGLLTAEELGALDLSSCELAVLSACETGVGLDRTGLGIHSLRSALHAAGARTAVTSLWKVDDAATRRLMELFYTHLWLGHAAPADALWKAKTELRELGHPPRDWAGWVLSGRP